MYTVTSADGTRIAYDRYGEGPAVILVSGALGYRKFKKFEQIATALSEHCTVINYDRRGRGDCDDAGLGDHNMPGRPLLAEEWATVTCPALVVHGSKTYPVLEHAAIALADVLPNATLRELPGQNHNVSPSAIVPLLAEFVAGFE